MLGAPDLQRMINETDRAGAEHPSGSEGMLHFTSEKFTRFETRLVAGEVTSGAPRQVGF